MCGRDLQNKHNDIFLLLLLRGETEINVSVLCARKYQFALVREKKILDVYLERERHLAKKNNWILPSQDRTELKC